MQSKSDQSHERKSRGIRHFLEVTDLPEAAYIQPPQLRIKKVIHLKDTTESVANRIQTHRERHDPNTGKQPIFSNIEIQGLHYTQKTIG